MTSADHASEPGVPLPIGADLTDSGRPRPPALRDAVPAAAKAQPSAPASVEYWYFCDDGSVMRRD